MAYWLALRTPGGSIRSFPLPEGETVLGRGARCDLRLALPSIAPIQCAVHRDSDNLRLEARSQDIPTLVNGSPATDQRLHEGDELRMGPVAFQIFVASDKKKIVYVHCAKGARAKICAGVLCSMGYDARPLKVSYEEFPKSGFEAVTKSN